MRDLHPLPAGALVPIRAAADCPPAYVGLVDAWGARRRDTFLAGRRAAHRALVRAGAGAAAELPIGRLESGAPLWPEGWTGAITHHGARAMAVAGPRPGRLGLDMEGLGRVGTAAAAARLCLSGPERARFATPADVIRAFSAKEAVFKALSDLADPAQRFWLPDIALTPGTEPGRIAWAALGRFGALRQWVCAGLVVSLCQM
ncbi:4'-phosphopantetheinyl transferase superfamily protein [Defluviimonas denitrificans]|uniref:Enterobactin synthase component D n=1 Tax=Albidovulum denitrificans TaxID=404881 RepID=A0A2S8S5I4_9RHOB|nr:4'-phosphopantetheinyl transferase superfamily protein [Defluviimonas denitrificans]PQV56056.1 4'-phosphopantetheinyl transferase superfamily protein [Defluviimonas denitrificans]